MTELTWLPSGVALRCDLHGAILSVLRDDLALLSSQHPPTNLFSLIDERSELKARGLLEEAVLHGAVFDSEINVKHQERVSLMYFNAALLDNGILVLITRVRDATARLANDLARLNNEQVNWLRTVIKEMTLLRRAQEESDHRSYDEFSRLTNELINLQRELFKKNQELSRLNDQKNQFVGWVAHDLRTPIAVIHGFSDILMEVLSGKIQDEHMRYLSNIHRASEFMRDLVNNILDIAQIEAGKLDLRTDEVDVAALLEQIVAMNAPMAERKSIRLVLEPLPPAPLCSLDRNKIEQVVNNLISNAVKFSRASTTIRVGIRAEEDAIVLWVADEGQGIPQAERERMFMPFQRTSVQSTGGERGTGLGLAIVQKIVEGHQGKIWVESEVGRGSTFFVRLPLRPQPLAGPASQSPPASSAHGGGGA